MKMYLCLAAATMGFCVSTPQASTSGASSQIVDSEAFAAGGFDDAMRRSATGYGLAESSLLYDPQTTLQERTETPAAPTGDAQALAKKLANPISNLISVPFQFNYDEGFGPKDAGRATLNIQPVIPFSISEDWNLISRTIVPIIYQDSVADGASSDFGIGDTVQSFFFSPKEPVNGWILGAGPVALLPTGTTPGIRSENFGLGPTVVALRQENSWTYGALANHIWGVTSSDDRDKVSETFLQPFVAYTWPTATTLTLNSEATYDWNESDWTVPVNLSLSQVMKLGDQPVSLQFGGRHYVESPGGGPEWGLRFTITFLFPK